MNAPACSCHSLPARPALRPQRAALHQRPLQAPKQRAPAVVRAGGPARPAIRPLSTRAALTCCRGAASEGEDDFDQRLGSLQGKGFGKTTPKQALKQSQERSKRGEGSGGLPGPLAGGAGGRAACGHALSPPNLPLMHAQAPCA